MNLKKSSLRFRIFLSMLFLVILSSVLMAVVTIYQYNEEAQEYHQDRLLRKENTLKDQIVYQLRAKTTYPINTKNIPLIFKEKNFIYELSDVHNLEIKLYNFKGEFLIASSASSIREQTSIPPEKLSKKIVLALENSIDKRHVTTIKKEGKIVQSSYSYIVDAKFKPLAILALPYIQDNQFMSRELKEYLRRMVMVYLVILLIAITLAYFLSKYITKSLQLITEKIYKTRLNKRNTKIEINNTSQEINTLVIAYNSMIEELQESAVKLAKSERKQAWREMAKQVAHEIKNPLTPMRLTVQSFQRRFNPQSPDVHQKLDEYSKTIIQQIDTMSTIAEAFSNFAKMPTQKKESLNVVEVVKLASEIFNKNDIQFSSEKEKIIILFDRTQLIRVITNLIKNAQQANAATIKIHIKNLNKQVEITVSDNGDGINEEHQQKIFEPNFTTKNSGMGLGLAMVKNIIDTYKGNITFASTKNKGTIFTVTLPK